MRTPARLARFGSFELDVRAGGLRKHGIRIKLPEQSFRILLMLLERPGEVVLREEIRLKLWPNNTIVEFDHSINAAIRRLRNALGDSAEDPLYIETVAKRGYRFMGEVELLGEAQREGNAVPSHYRLLEKVGEGGMGVVYRAEDLKLGRFVAVKFLPTTDEEPPESIRQRFEREARAASALNHPNICTIFGLEDLNGKPAIVMELVEGETLAERIAGGRLPLDEALRIAIQIAGALAEAHRKGIVHRDLKPANIMLTKSGVKVLDFGLAKIERPMTDGDCSVHQPGRVMGTLRYMSPEQAQGGETDASTDIFSFGVMLYEMVAGKRPFDGDSFEPEPPPLALEPLGRIVRRCLNKDADERWQSPADLKAALEWIAGTTSQPHSKKRVGAAAFVAALFAAAAGVTLFVHLREKPLEERVVRLQILPPGDDRFAGEDAPVLSPDGTRVAFSAGNGRALFVRSLDSVATKQLPGTEGGQMPFWSPDGRSLGFFADGKLKKTSPLGDPPVVLCDVEHPKGGAWNRDGVILVGPTLGLIVRVSAGGGGPSRVASVDPPKAGIRYAWPSFLPDGKHFLFTVYASQPDPPGVFLGSLDSPQITRLVPEAKNAQYTEPGYIVFSRAGNLMAQRFDAGRMRLTGEPFSVAQGVSEDGRLGFAAFSASAGVLAYRTGSEAGPTRLRWFDRKGGPRGDVGPAGEYETPALSPDGAAVAVALRRNSPWQIWLVDLGRGTNSRLTFGGGGAIYPSWSPDGRHIAFCFYDKSRWVIGRMATNGTGEDEMAAQLDRDVDLSQWTADGRYLIMTAYGSGRPSEIWAAPLSAGKPFLVATGRFDSEGGRVSPDGKWIAYSGNETGQREVYVRDFPPKGAKWQLSTLGGEYPRWRADGRELFYREGSKVMGIELRGNAGELEAGIPKKLFDMPRSRLPRFDVSADGQRFLLLVPNDDVGPQQPFTVVKLAGRSEELATSSFTPFQIVLMLLAQRGEVGFGKRIRLKVWPRNWTR